MTGFALADDVLDHGLSAFALANKIIICSAEPTTYQQANTYTLGYKDFGAGNVFGLPTPIGTSGLKITSVPVTNGIVTVTGVPVCWAVVDDANSRLLSSGSMGVSGAVRSGTKFRLGSFSIVFLHQEAPKVLVASNLTTSPPPLIIGPVLQQKHALKSVSLAPTSRVFGTPQLRQKQVLTASSLSTGSPSFGAPAPWQGLRAESLVVPSPYLKALPQFKVSSEHALTAQSLTTGSPVFGAAFLNRPPVEGLLTSAGVFDSTGKLVRTLWSSKKTLDARNPVAAWDGTIDDGSVAPTGTYTVKLLQHDVHYTWEGVVGNTSPNHVNVVTYHNPACPISDMDISDAGEMYYSSGYTEKWGALHWTTTANPQVTNYIWGQANYPEKSFVSSGPVATDGINAYFFMTNLWEPTVSFVHAVDCATKMRVQFSAAELYENWFYAIGKRIGTSNYDGVSTGMAVQKGPDSPTKFLFFSRPGQNSVYTLNKTTGASLQTNTSFINPGAMEVSPTTGDLWLAHSTNGGVSTNAVSKLTADVDGALTATGVSITGFSEAMAVAVSPDGNTVLVVDAGTSQQVKAFNTSDGSVKTAWGNSGTLGVSGGYASSPTVTSTKFMFKLIPGMGMGGWPTYIAYAPDGSFWLGDGGNARNLHFSSGNSPTYIEQIAFIPSFYSCRITRNEPTRVFSMFLEWEIDYSKTLEPGNGSWTLVNNWAYGAPDSQYNCMKFVGKYSNGRTYALLGNYHLYELTSSGVRDTGKIVPQGVVIDKDLNLWSIETKYPGEICHIYKNAFVQFDGQNNPVWQQSSDVVPATLYLTTQTLPTLFPTTGVPDPNFDGMAAQTASGVIPIFNTHSSYETPGALNHHFGGIDAVTGFTKFSTHPVNPPSYGGTGLMMLLYPEAPYFPVGCGVGDYGGGPLLYEPGEAHIFTGYRGESWGNAQTNIWSHWHESGLLVSEFGVAAPSFAAASLTHYTQDNYPYAYKGLAGMAGNVAWGGIAKVDDAYYIYHNDEWYHGGMHRWKIDNLDSLLITTEAVNWNSNSYTPRTDSTDMLAGLPYGQTGNLANGAGGWSRSPTSDDTTSRYNGPWFKVYTNAINCDPRKSPDLVLEAKWSGHTCTVEKSFPSGTGSNWTIDMAALMLVGSFSSQYPDANSLLYIDVLDNAGKKLLRLYQGWNWETNLASLYVNDSPITTPVATVEWDAYIGAVRPLVITANPSAGNMHVVYGDYSTTKNVYEAGAAIGTAAKLRLTYVGGGGAYALPGISLTSFNFRRVVVDNLTAASLTTSSPTLASPVVTVSNIEPVFGPAADRVNMLFPQSMNYNNVGAGNGNVGPSQSYLAAYYQDATKAANYIDDWLLGPGPYPQAYAALPATVSLGSQVLAPDGSMTGRKIVETSNPSGGVGIDQVKPALWALHTGAGGTHADWNTFWSNAIAVVPCWEGSGNPHYYGWSGGAITDKGQMTPVNSPQWGTTRQGTCLHFTKHATAAPDWRIPAVGGQDVCPVTNGTFLLVRKALDRDLGISDAAWAATPGPGYRFGLTSSDRLYFNISAYGAWYNGDLTCWINARHRLQQCSWVAAPPTYATTYDPDGRANTYQPSIGVEIWAITVSHAGLSIYLNGRKFSTTTAWYSDDNPVDSSFGLNSAYLNDGVLGSAGGDILFFAMLNTEWTEAQVQSWTRDPYAPIRQGVGAGAAVTPTLTQHHYLTAGFLDSAGQTANLPKQPRYRLSVFAKAAERKRIVLWVGDRYLNSTILKGVHQAIFDLENGVVVKQPTAMGGRQYEQEKWTAGTATITPDANGWYRCEIDFGLPRDGITDKCVRAFISIDRETGSHGEETDYFGDGTSGVYLWQTRMLPPRLFDLDTRLFHDDFNNIATIDVNNTKQPGYNFYVNNWWPSFGNRSLLVPSTPDLFSVANSELTMVYDPNGPAVETWAYTMSAAYIGPENTGWVGPAPGYDPSYFVGRTFTPPFMWESRHKSDNTDPAEPNPRGIFGGYDLRGAMTPGVGGTITNQVWPPNVPMIEVELAESRYNWAPGSGIGEWQPGGVGNAFGASITLPHEANAYHTYAAVALPHTDTEMGTWVGFVNGRFSGLQWFWDPDYTQAGVLGFGMSFETAKMMIAFGGYSSVWDHISVYGKKLEGPWLGRVADRITMALPARIEWSSGGTWGPGSNMQYTFTVHMPDNYGQVGTDGINNLTGWLPGWGPSHLGYQTTVPGTETAIIGPGVMAPDNTLTAHKLIESDDADGGIGFDLVKPAEWSLHTGSGGVHSDWNAFWSSAVAVVPCWEGTGDPKYYGANCALIDTLTPVNSPQWGTTRQGPCLRLTASDTGPPDWQIDPVGGVDVLPPTNCTILLVRKCHSHSLVRKRFWGLKTNDQYVQVGGYTSSNDFYMADRVNYVRFHWGGQAELDWNTYDAQEDPLYVPSTGVEVWAFTASRSGLSMYFNGKKRASNSTWWTDRSRGNYAFGFNVGLDNLSQSEGSDILFAAILNAEWTEAQVKAWMADPYAPIRVGVAAGSTVTSARPKHHYVSSGFKEPVVGFNTATKPVWLKLAFFARAGERKRIVVTNSIEFQQGTAPKGVQAIFDLQNCQVVQQTHVTGALPSSDPGPWDASRPATITDKGDGWRLCEMEFAPPSNWNSGYSVRTLLSLDIGTGTNVEESDYIGDGTSGVYIWRTSLLPSRAFALNNVQFHDDFDVMSVDLQNTKQPGFKWYRNAWWPSWGDPAVVNANVFPPSIYGIADSKLTFIHDPAKGGDYQDVTWNYTCSACYTGPTAQGSYVGPEPGYHTEYYVGNVFVLPAYIEARMLCETLTPDNELNPPAINTTNRGDLWFASIEAMMTPPAGSDPVLGPWWPPSVKNPEGAVIDYGAPPRMTWGLQDWWPTGENIRGIGLNPWGSNNQWATYGYLYLKETADENGMVISFRNGHWMESMACYASDKSWGGHLGAFTENSDQHFPLLIGGLTSVWDWVSVYGE